MQRAQACAGGARNIKIINIGLEPWEAVVMGLEVESVEESKRRKPVADYVLERDSRSESDDWETWLQTGRVELSAMTTPQFIEWLDQKMAKHGSGKLIPPPDVLTEELAESIDRKVRTAIAERILREAGFEDQVAAAIAAIKTRTPRPWGGTSSDCSTRSRTWNGATRSRRSCGSRQNRTAGTKSRLRSTATFRRAERSRHSRRRLAHECAGRAGGESEGAAVVDPAELARLGYKLNAEPDGQRRLPAAITEAVLTEGATGRPVQLRPNMVEVS